MATYIISALLLVALFAALYSLRKNKKAGKGCGSCQSCAHSGCDHREDQQL